jgi:hypothetical protein
MIPLPNIIQLRKYNYPIFFQNRIAQLIVMPNIIELRKYNFITNVRGNAANSANIIIQFFAKIVLRK